MAFSAPLSHVVLVITAAVLFYVALTDFKQFKIRNELILVLAGLFVVHALLSGRWVSAHWNLAFAALMFGVMLYFYGQNLMGGGDVKILTVGFLWVGFRCALAFAVLLAIFAAPHVVAAKFGWAQVQQVDDKKRIPLAPSVAGALILCFILGCLQPISSPTQLSQFPLSHFTRPAAPANWPGGPALTTHGPGTQNLPARTSWPWSCACHPCLHSVAPRTLWFLHFAQW
jgi:prepilin peptidase CpaA